VAAAAGLVVLAPLMAAIAVALKLEGRGPVLYSGRRVGPGGRRFGQLKFRSMRVHTAAEFEAMLDADPALREEFERTQKLTDDPRVTRIGAFLRKTSLDELPQLWNVLRGDLSLVGPRPITDRELNQKYAKANDSRCLAGYWHVPGLRPGLPASGRSAAAPR
jgi:lipopolysaccharide/colanic/teichoic acid biosynthesis glycosyltransferase